MESDDIFRLEKESYNEEIEYDVRLRPEQFQDFIGQSSVVANINMMVKSAQKRNKAMDHVLLAGPPGLGKTTLAYLIAKVLDSNLHVITGPAIDKKGDLAATLTNLGPKDILFIDEIHRLPISIEEMLYSAMEDFRLDILIGSGATARSMQIDLVPFTIIGATTRTGLLSSPLRDRFQANLHFEFYQTNELAEIILMNSKKLGIRLNEKALRGIAGRSRGTPRIANRILRRMRDFAVVHDLSEISSAHVDEAMGLLEIDSIGLDSMDRKILRVILDYYQGGPVGIEALCATLNEDRTTIEDVYEPYLLKKGLLLRTARGRLLSDAAREHLDSADSSQ